MFWKNWVELDRFEEKSVSEWLVGKVHLQVEKSLYPRKEKGFSQSECVKVLYRKKDGSSFTLGVSSFSYKT